MKITTLSIAASATLVSFKALAVCPAGVDLGASHTTHKIIVNKDATCVLSKTFEQEHFCLIDDKGNDLSGVSFDVAPGTTPVFNLVFDDETDFNMEYALTCTVNDGNWKQSPKVIFNIGADGPAIPAISTTALYGAQGSWVSTGDGEDYTFTF